MAHRVCRVLSFEISGPYRLRVHFDDATEQLIDFVPVLAGELYGPLKDLAVFERVRIDPEVHTLVWPNGADFDPETLHDWPRYAEGLARRARQWEEAEAREGRVTGKRFFHSGHEPAVHPGTMKSPQQLGMVGAGLCACAEISSRRLLSCPSAQSAHADTPESSRQQWRPAHHSRAQSQRSVGQPDPDETALGGGLIQRRCVASGPAAGPLGMRGSAGATARHHTGVGVCHTRRALRPPSRR